MSCGSFVSPLVYNVSLCFGCYKLQKSTHKIFYYTLLSYLETWLCRWTARCKVNSIYYLCRYSLTHIFLCIVSFSQQNCLIVIEMDLLSTPNIGFGWGMKTSFEYSYYSVFMIKVTPIHIILYTISFYMCFGSLKESSHWDGSFEYPQYVVINKKKYFGYAFLSKDLS